MVNFNPIDKDYSVRWQSDLENTKERLLYKPSQDQRKSTTLGGVLNFAERCVRPGDVLRRPCSSLPPVCQWRWWLHWTCPRPDTPQTPAGSCETCNNTHVSLNEHAHTYTLYSKDVYVLHMYTFFGCLKTCKIKNKLNPFT